MVPTTSLAKPISYETPCVGICSTIYGDDVCRGCFRTLEEVTDWNRYQNTQKLDILERLNAHITRGVTTKLTVIDPALLKARCLHYRVRIRDDFSPYTWAHALLREGLHGIKDITKYGIRIHPEFAHLSLAKLIEVIDDELFGAASACQKNSICL